MGEARRADPGVLVREARLHAREDVDGDEGRPVAGLLGAESGHEATGIQRIAEDAEPGRDRDPVVLARLEAVALERAEHVDRTLAGGHALESAGDERRARRVGEQARLALPDGAGEIAQGREPDPSALRNRGPHPDFRPIGAQVVIELRHAGEDRFHEAAGRRVVDRLGDGAERDPLRAQERGDRVVIGRIAREAREAIDDDGAERRAVLPAVGEQRLKLRALRRLGALATVDEHARDLVSLRARRYSRQAFS